MKVANLFCYKGRPEDGSGRSEKEIRVYDYLDNLGIEYDRIDHAPTESEKPELLEAIENTLGARICNNLFLANRQRTRFYLLMLPAEKRFRSSDISKQAGSSRLHFAEPEYMEELIDCVPGSASVMGLINDQDHRVQLLVDKDVLRAEYVGCHPCINTTSLRIRTRDLFGPFLEETGHEYITVRVGPESGRGSTIMSGTMRLETERMILRRYVFEDADFLYTCFGTDEKMYEYTGWNPYATPDAARETVRRYIENYQDEHFFGWAIEADGETIGTIGAYDYDPVDSSIEVGLSIARSFWGSGYATEALSTVLRYLTEDAHISVVRAWCASDNQGSRKAMEKAGMNLVSVDKDALSFHGNTFDRLNYEYRL